MKHNADTVSGTLYPHKCLFNYSDFMNQSITLYVQRHAAKIRHCFILQENPLQTLNACVESFLIPLLYKFSVVSLPRFPAITGPLCVCELPPNSFAPLS